MDMMNLLNRCFKIFIISLLNLGNTISATDLDVYTCLGEDIFYFNEEGKFYSFMVLDFSVNGKKYELSNNEKLKDLILKNIPEEEINLIKTEIIKASKLGKDKDLKEGNYKKLIDRVEVVRLKKNTQDCDNSYKYVIKVKKGSYYSSYYEFLHNTNEIRVGSFESKDSEEDSEEDLKYKDWEEDSRYTEIIYVIRDLIINNNKIDEQLKLCAAVTEYDCKEIDRNLCSWCQDCNFRSFGTLHTDMDFKKLILSCYKKKNKYQNVYAAYELGYLNKTLEKFEAKFKRELQLFIANNTEYELYVKLIKEEDFNNPIEHNVYIKVRPDMTYGELFRAVIKKCRKIEELSADDYFSSIRRNRLCINDIWYENFEDVLALSKNNDKIMLDIEYLKFEYYVWEHGFDPKYEEDMLWKEINGLCKDEENKPVEKQEQEEDEEKKSVEQDNDKELEEEHVELKVKKEVNGKEPVESKVKKEVNGKEPVEQKFKKKVKVKELEKSEVKKKGKVNKPEESKVTNKGKVNKLEESKVTKKCNGNEHEESKVIKKGNGNGFNRGCCTCCKGR